MTGMIMMKHLTEWVGGDKWQADVAIDGDVVAVFSGYPRDEALEKARAFLRSKGKCQIIGLYTFGGDSANRATAN